MSDDTNARKLCSQFPKNCRICEGDNCNDFERKDISNGSEISIRAHYVISIIFLLIIVTNDIIRI